MAKKDFSFTFKNAFIDVENDTITEVTRDGNFEHVLSEVLEELEGKQLNIGFKESIEVLPDSEEE